MTIPKDLLENCRIFCEKLPNIIANPIDDLENLKKDVKQFTDNIIIATLYSKNIAVKDEQNLSFDDNNVFIGIVKGYFFLKPIQKENIYYKLSQYSISGFLEYNLWRSIWNLQITLSSWDNKLLYIGFILDQLNKVEHTTIDWKRINEYCQKYYLWLLELNHYVLSKENNFIEFNRLALSFSLKHFSISNFQCIKHIEAQLPVDAQFIVFTGENGDGKTSILQALSLGFYNTKDLRDNEKGNTDTVITVQYKANSTSYHNEIYNNPKFPTLYSLRNNIEELKNFAAYGASRLQLESVESADNQKLLRSPVYNLFYSNGILQNIERWLRIRLLKVEPERYNKVIELLVKLLPNVTAIEREDTADDVIFVYTEKGIKIPIEHLSSGHKSIVAMIGDMVIRLSSAQPEITNPKDFAGIVLIDELETHLHPKWQKEFPKILSETFPKVQFIVTTHSAITLLGMPKNTVFFKVTRTESAGTQIERLEIDVENLTPNLLLSSPIFGLADIFSVQNKGMENVHTGNFYDEKDTRQQAKDKIRSLYKQLKDKENNEKSN